ncbi:hypothetical protein KIH27_05085 [Mycobacterium sp. M1]|uniref:DUF4157 domain-containing protein n=1 Tax=Mycolicibacter acidiphilus TaxID=2835306 RepID=A0ABS5RG38_9MYCO|nr:hypothetical protein [Mycolicibacter acidiphilus]MBS9532962.1 hypothetical protein [Mycolicibacter acidiphilus]
MTFPAERASDPALVVGEHRTVELVNRGGPQGQALLDRIAVNIGASVEAVEAFWGTDWSHRIVVTATDSARQFAALASGDTDGDIAQWSDVAAVAVADRVDPQHRLVIGQRVVFAPDADEMSTPALRIVLTHELFHYATRVDTAADAPRWLVEGVADFVARPEQSLAALTGSVLTLPSDADLDTPGPSRTQAYDRAWAFARFVADWFGPAKLRELYLAACGIGHVDVASAVHRVLGVGLPDVLAGWQQWLASLR